MLKNRFTLIKVFSIVFIFIAFITRTILLLLSIKYMGTSPFLIGKVYLIGLFFDVITFFYFAIPFVLYLIFIPDKIFCHKLHKYFLYIISFLTIYLILFSSTAEYFFFDEFGSRFNFIAVNYLIYTREVTGNIKESYNLPVILSFIGFATFIITFSIKKIIVQSLKPIPFKKRIQEGFIYLLIPLVALFTVNESNFPLTQNNYAQEVSRNGIYQFFAAFKNNTLDYEKFYKTFDHDFVLKRLRNLLSSKDAHFVNDNNSYILRKIESHGKEKKMNVIVVVEESMGAEYLGAYGNPQNLTPNMDKLAKESLFFTNIYATGTRTIRGLEAIALSLPPVPGNAIARRPNNNNLFTWGTVMKNKGYETKFIYGGYGYFDNMNNFFEGNGFKIIDRKDFNKDEITFSNIWGVCDEDLFKKVINEADNSYLTKKPFFSIVMTTSNHRPYTYPHGKIDIPPGKREGAVKYADYAISYLLKEAKTKAWFEDTIFVIVADHCASTAGKEDIPVNKFHIPLFIFNHQLKPAIIDTLASQMDIAPTVLGLMNFQYESKFFGENILKMPKEHGRAFVSTYEKLGYIKGHKMVVLKPKKQVNFYDVNLTYGFAKDTHPIPELLFDAVTYYQSVDYFYKNGKL